MDKLTRIASAIERIAAALEKELEPIVAYQETIDPMRWCWTGPTANANFGIDYSMIGDDKTDYTAKEKFDWFMDFGKLPDDGSTRINIKCRNAKEFREQYMQQPRVDDTE